MATCIYFDLDGTLTDSGEGIMNCAAKTLLHYGIQPPQGDGLRAFVGPPLRESFPQWGIPQERVEEAIRIYRGFYVPEGMFQNRPYDGIINLLKKLKADGYRLFVATSKPEAMAVAILDKFEMAEYFEGIVGAVADGKVDTKAQVIGELLRRYPDAEDAVMVGDTAYDILGAAEHQMAAIGVSWGFGEVRDMEKAGAKAIAHSMDELYDILTKEKERA
ncbi:MAG: HAD hydrolase-like protein [Oscillospiraceae bacterium]|nr:HAD hydrolase-like protein [Oscillospiraceae bacterium]